MPNWIALLPAPRTTPGEPNGSLGSPQGRAGPDAINHAINQASPDSAAEAGPLDALHLGWWALQFTPRVALLENSVVLEVASSERLFRGRQALTERITSGAARLGVSHWAQAGTARAALALARARPGWCQDEAPDALTAALAPLPLESIDAIGQQAATLSRMGCRTLGDVRALPRAGLSRRLGSALLQALDEAHGLRPQAFDWLALPEVFDSQMEMPHRVETAAPLLDFFMQLIHPLCAWLAGHQAGCETLHLRWCHEWSHHGHDRWQAHVIRMAQPTRDAAALATLLREHLQRIELAAPVTDIGLKVDALIRQQDDNAELFGGSPLDGGVGSGETLLPTSAWRAQRQALLSLMDKLSVRLGPQRVQQACLQADHRLEHAQLWTPALTLLRGGSERGAPELLASIPDGPQPSWLLPRPLPLALATHATGRGEAPVFQGTLQLLAGPQRIEAGWWDASCEAPLVARDHHLASSAQAGLLWVYRLRQAPGDGRSPWFLQGFFA